MKMKLTLRIGNKVLKYSAENNLLNILDEVRERMIEEVHTRTKSVASTCLVLGRPEKRVREMLTNIRRKRITGEQNGASQYIAVNLPGDSGGSELGRRPPQQGEDQLE